MPTIDGIQLGNSAMGWTHRSTSEPLSSYENDLSELKRAGRDGVVPIPGDTAAVLLRIVVQTPRAGLESLIALFKQGKVWGDGGREAAMEFRSHSPAGFGPADQLVDASFVIRLPGAFRRALAAETATQTITAATHTLSCFAARAMGQVAQWRNLLMAPDFEAPGATTVVRTNRVNDPAPPVSAGAPASNMWKTNRAGNGTLSVPVAGEVLYTITTGGTGLTEGVYVVGDAAVVGGFYAATIEVKAEGSLVGRNLPAGTLPVLHNGAQLAAATGITSYDGTWQKMTVVATAASATTNAVNLIAYIPGALAGDALRVRFPMMDQVPAAGRSDISPFFTGATRPAVSTNLSTNPNAVAGVGFQTNNAATWTVARNVAAPAGNPQGITTAASSVLNGPQSTITLMSIYNLDTLSNTGPGRRIGAWFWVNAAGYQGKINSSDTPVPLTANAWTWVAPGAITPGTSYAGAFVEKMAGQGNAGVSDIAYVTGVTAFSDGATPQRTLAGGVTAPDGFTSAWTGAANASTTVLVDADLSVRWRGTVNASPSEQTGVVPAGISTANIAGRAVVVQSTRAVKSGSKSARIILLAGANGDEYVQFDIPGPGRVAGTAIAHRYQEGAITLSGVGATRGLRAVVFAPETASLGLANAAGWQEMRVSYPTLTANYQLRLYHGGLYGSGDVWWDLAALVPGAYTGPAFTGATAPPDRLNTIVWDGLPDQSSSTWTVFGSWDGGLSAPIQDAMLRMKGPATGIQVSDAGGSWAILPDVPAGKWVRFEADTGAAFLTDTDVWSGGTEVSGLCDYGGPRGVFEITPVMAPADPSSRSGQLTVTTATRPGAPVFEVRGKAAYLL